MAVPDSITMSSILKKRLTRREWIAGAGLVGGSLFCGFELIGCQAPISVSGGDSFEGGKLLGTINFIGEDEVPFAEPTGTELDGRLRVDLSKLTADDFVTPTDKFYIRSLASRLLSYSEPWVINLANSTRRTNLPAKELVRDSKPCGLHLMECAGNSRAGSFGLLSVANWTGVPLLPLLDRYFDVGEHHRVRISGFDKYLSESKTSIAGASWSFSLNEIRASGAFLATGMNGDALLPDHGSPVRLVVPGWYGCACIKWVNEIALEDENSLVTSQMQEFAARTHQNGMPILAREYEPAIIDAAAMPIRVEKWIRNGKLTYRIVGIIWGGSTQARNIRIQFNKEDLVRVEKADRTESGSWWFWTYHWSPRKAGTYTIRMIISDARVRTRRLDLGFYARTVKIEEY
jgi:DMSO/TMAO reductase YedYZ molybdopterin-dependent catalytic subunit